MLALSSELSAVLDAVPAHIAVLNGDGQILAVNRAWRSFAVGNELNNDAFCVGQNYLTACDRVEGPDGELAQRAADGIRSVLGGQAPLFEFDYPCHSPSRQCWFRMSAMRAQLPWNTNAVVMHVEITDRKLAEIALEESLADQRALTERLEKKRATLLAAQAIAKLGNWQIDLQTLRMTWSSELFRIVGIESDTVDLDLDRFLGAVHHDDRDRVAAAFRERSASPDVRTLNHRIVTPQNQTKFVTERWQVATGVDGQSLVAIGTCQDITERMTLEDRVRQSERLEALGQLTGGVAHDFNNLLTVILGNAETLGESLERQRDLQLLAEMTAAAAERGAELTKRLLAFARRQDLAPQTIDLNAQVVGMERLLRRTLPENIGINVQLGDPLGRALIDPGQLEVAVLNLALNARDAMPDGGRLTLQTANVVLDDAYAGAVSEVVSGPYVMLAITDNGVGMNQVTLDRAFEPFFTTKEVGKGSGLGLSMVYGFIKQSNGHVEIHSELGHGTSAKLYLPQAKADAPQPISKPTASPLPTGSEVVLLVEDDGLVRNYAATQLRSLGYQVVAAVDGLEAMRILATRSDVALLFTDYIMPNGMNGGQLAENARRLRPDLPVLFTSGYSEGAIDSAIGAQLLRKPYRRQELALKIRHALDDRPIRH